MPGKNPNSYKWLIVGRAIQKKNRAQEERKTVSGLISAIDDLADRALLVTGREIRARLKAEKIVGAVGDSISREMEVRAEIRAGIWAEIMGRLAISLGSYDSAVVETVGRPLASRTAPDGPEVERWKTAVLEPRHIERYGDRRCQSCGRIVEAYERVAWVVPHGEKIWHSECKPRAKTAVRMAPRVYTFAERHLQKHGQKVCAICDAQIRIGESVRWVPGETTISHADCT